MRTDFDRRSRRKERTEGKHCTGKVYEDINGHRKRHRRSDESDEKMPTTNSPDNLVVSNNAASMTSLLELMKHTGNSSVNTQGRDSSMCWW